MNPSSLAFETLVREAISVCRSEKKKQPPADPDMAKRLHEAADHYARVGKPGQAEELHLQALAVCEQTLGDLHPAVAESLLKLADLYQKEGRATAAEPRVRRALAIRQRSLGPAHASVAECLDILVSLYQVMHRKADAALLASRAAEIRGFGTTRVEPQHEAVSA